LSKSVHHRKLEELYKNKMYQKIFAELLKYRNEYDADILNPELDITQRVIAVEKKRVIDIIIDLPLDIVEAEDR